MEFLLFRLLTSAWLLGGCVYITPTERDARWDLDGDGIERPRDCDDSDASVGTPIWYADTDGDGFGDPTTGTRSCTPPDGFVASADDCDDDEPLVNPEGVDGCDGLDNDCDGAIDEDPDVWFDDADGDGFGDPKASVRTCDPPKGYVQQGDDCDDDDVTRNPLAAELCNDVDDDCDDLVDDDDPGVDAPTWHPDDDGDGYGAATGVARCEPPAGHIADDSDCDDDDDASFPDALELCNGADNDCDGTPDFPDVQGSRIWYLDNDSDGYGDPDNTVRTCLQPSGYVADDSDCADTISAVNPGADEACDGVDNNCDTLIDDAAPDLTDADSWWVDGDEDGFGDPGARIVACNQPPGAVDNDADCDDRNDAISPSATEICDGIDNDCDTDVDDADPSLDPASMITFYTDNDGDGRGVGAPQTACIANGALLDSDCDDNAPLVAPGLPELCDGIDNDCDTIADNGAGPVTWYRDDDSDGFGDSADTVLDCVVQPGFVLVGGDCDDAMPTVNPGALEICDTVDNDCNALADDDDPGVAAPKFFPDVDQDGFGDFFGGTPYCVPPAGYANLAGDCDDTLDFVHPGADELCNGIDDDCDQLLDDLDPDVGDPVPWYLDRDDDGFGNPDIGFVLCSPPDGYVSDDTDCDDNSSAAGDIFPGAPVSPVHIDDGVDQDCDGVDECALDDDGDGWGSTIVPDDGDGVCLGGEANLAGDCDDEDTDVFPGAPVIVSDAVDQDCDGVDECFFDEDGDGYAVAAAVTVPDDGDGICDAPDEADVDGDCDDLQPTVYTGAPELCDGLDNDCNTVIDDGVAGGTFFHDDDGDGFGDPDDSVTACVAPSDYITDATDCDDTDIDVFPGAPLTFADAADGIDRDCNGFEECSWDRDGDGFGRAFEVLIDDDGDGLCDDGEEGTDFVDCVDWGAEGPFIFPGAPEACTDGIDNDCDLQIDIDDSACTAWVDQDCGRRIRLDVADYGTASFADFPVLVVLDPGNIDYAEIDPTSFRFYDPDGTELPRDVEHWEETGPATSWVWTLIDTGEAWFWLYYDCATPTPANPTAVWPGYAAVWHLDDLDDASSNGNHGTDSGTSAVTGAVGDGRRVQFGDAIDVPGDPTLQIQGDITVSSWLYIDTYGASTWDNVVAGTGGFADAEPENYAWFLNVQSDTTLAAFWEYGPGNDQWAFSTVPTGIAQGAWHHVAFVRDNAGMAVDFYLDGMPLGGTVPVANLPTGGVTGVTQLGNDPCCSDASFALDGRLDEVRVYPGARDADWMLLQHASMVDAMLTFNAPEP